MGFRAHHGAGVNAAYGSADRWLVDVSARTGGRRSTGEVHTVVATRLPGPVPEVTVREETVASRAAHAVGLSDVTVGTPDFDDRFDVTARDQRFAEAALGPVVVQRLLMLDPPVDWRLRDDVTLLAGRRVDRAGLSARMRTLEDLASVIPGHEGSRDRT